MIPLLQKMKICFYGGDGGADRLIEERRRCLIASGFADNGEDELTGGAGQICSHL